MDHWYLNPHKIGAGAPGSIAVGLPLARTVSPVTQNQVRRWGMLVDSIVPLFPCYVFALFDIEQRYRLLGYPVGVREVACVGGEFLAVNDSVIEDLKGRCVHGPIELPDTPIRNGESGQVLRGPFRGLGAVFEGYLAGSERVRILFSSLKNAGLRLVLPASSVALVPKHAS
jgi:transcriptional antiterminator RfaH